MSLWSLIEFELSMSHWLFQPPTSFANYRAGGTGVAGVAAATPIFWLFQGLNKKNFENQTEIGGYVCCRHPKILDRAPALCSTYSFFCMYKNIEKSWKSLIFPTKICGKVSVILKFVTE